MLDCILLHNKCIVHSFVIIEGRRVKWKRKSILFVLLIVFVVFLKTEYEGKSMRCFTKLMDVTVESIYTFSNFSIYLTNKWTSNWKAFDETCNFLGSRKPFYNKGH